MRTFAVVLASLLFVGGCFSSAEMKGACEAAYSLANSAADSLTVATRAPECATMLSGRGPSYAPPRP